MKKRKNLIEFCDDYYWLPPEKGGDKWKTRGSQKAIMLMWMHPDVKELGFIKPTQYGASEIAAAASCYLIDQGVSNIYYMPKDALAKDHSNDTFKHWIRSVPSLNNSLVCGDVDKRNDPDNKWDKRKFFTATQYCKGAGSPSNTAVIPVRFGTIDEPDRTDENIGGEGGLIGLLLGRFGASPVGGRLRLLGSPTIDGSSAIQNYINSCKQNVATCQIPCARCGEYQVLDWGDKNKRYGIKWDASPDIDESVKSVRYVCRFCEGQFSQAEYKIAEDECKWISIDGKKLFDYSGDGDFRDAKTNELVRPPQKFGLRLSEHGAGLYGTVPWGEGVRQCRNAYQDLKDNQSNSLLIPFENTFLGKCHTPKKIGVADSNKLLKRREKYSHPIPKGVQLLTLGADFGARYSKYQIDGHGAKGERWAIESKKIDGDSRNPDSRVFTLLDKIMSDEYMREDGALLPICMSILDGRYAGGNVKSLASLSPLNRVVVWGDGDNPKRELFQFDKTSDWDEEAGCFALSINPHKASDRLYRKLEVPEGRPGYYHFPDTEDFDRFYFDELTSDEPYQKPWKTTFVTAYKKAHSSVDGEAHDNAKYNGVALVAATVYGGYSIDHDYLPDGEKPRISLPEKLEVTEQQMPSPTQTNESFSLSDAY